MANQIWLDIIGVAADQGLDRLGQQHLQRLMAAQHIVAAKRFHGGLKRMELTATPRPWPQPFNAIYPLLDSWRGQATLLLATGDPLWYGIASSIRQHLPHIPPTEIRITPAVSAFQLAASRLGWGLAEVACLSLHGRAVAGVASHLAPRVRLLLLGEDKTTPQQTARLLVDNGYGAARLTALANMDRDSESRRTGTASDWAAQVPAIADCHVLAVECPPYVAGGFLPTSPGLPDAAYANDGMLTKAEVRAITLAKLQPAPGQLLWDLGCGSGSIGIEWMRAAQKAHAIGIDNRPDRLEVASKNATRLGVPDWQGVHADNRQALVNLPDPDAVFIGGGLDASLVASIMPRLKLGGRLVANGVSLATEVVLAECYNHYGGGLTRIAISHADALGSGQGWRAGMPITQWAFVKQDRATA